jgi:hypothetical protein
MHLLLLPRILLRRAQRHPLRAHLLGDLAEGQRGVLGLDPGARLLTVAAQSLPKFI